MPTWRGFLIRGLISSLIIVVIGLIAASPPAPTEIVVTDHPRHPINHYRIPW